MFLNLKQLRPAAKNVTVVLGITCHHKVTDASRLDFYVLFFSQKQTVHHDQRNKQLLVVLCILKCTVGMQNTVYLSECSIFFFTVGKNKKLHSTMMPPTRVYDKQLMSYGRGGASHDRSMCVCACMFLKSLVMLHEYV